MSQAEELLNSLSGGNTIPYIIGDEPHIVVNSDRTITVPDELKHIAVQFDHNIETVTFDCPRYWDNHDFSKMHVYINYRRSDGYKDQYPADNLRVDESDSTIIHFEWTISKNVTQVKGGISFLVCIKVVNDDGNEEPHWNSRLNQDLVIDEGMECSKQIVESNPDIIEHLLSRMEELENSGGLTEDLPEHEHSWNSLTDKPFGENITIIENIFNEQEISLNTSSMYGKTYGTSFITCNSEFVNGDYYLVTIDGIKYICQAYQGGFGTVLGVYDTSDLTYLQNPSVPFSITHYNADILTDKSVVTLKIDHINYGIKVIDEKYIPSTVARISDIQTDDHINSLIDAKLGVIENGTY